MQYRTNVVHNLNADISVLTAPQFGRSKTSEQALVVDRCSILSNGDRQRTDYGIMGQFLKYCKLELAFHLVSHIPCGSNFRYFMYTYRF
ncbi:hypothetical protein J6590_031506 [Homalodisca vitripennis]|nr:hypothetical protein J6590_031506 [Homalodisca vitripennis]